MLKLNCDDPMMLHVSVELSSTGQTLIEFKSNFVRQLVPVVSWTETRIIIIVQSHPPARKQIQVSCWVTRTRVNM